MTIRLHIHGHAGVELPAIEPPCCMGAAARGPDGCTCWEIEHDQPQHFTPRSREDPAQRERLPTIDTRNNLFRCATQYPVAYSSHDDAATGRVAGG